MNSDNNLLDKLNNVDFRKKNKWKVEYESLLDE